MSVLPPREKSEKYLARHTDETLSRAIWLVGFGYIFYYVNLRGLMGGTLDVTTEWLCYAIQLPALGALSRSERSAALLKPLAWLLLAYHAALCALGLLGIEIPAEYLYLPGCIAAVLALYFHFQLLTNVAAVAADYDKSRAGCAAGRGGDRHSRRVVPLYDSAGHIGLRHCLRHARRHRSGHILARRA